MIREDRFVLSRRQYAVDLASLRGNVTCNSRRPRFDGRITAVWFRRRKGVDVACVGNLWDIQDVEPPDGRTFLVRHTDGRYGGTCEGRWDGERYWGAQAPAEIEQHLALLRPMLDRYPAIPGGFDGWWRF